ncbi:MAG: tryptophan synthase subunit alpha [Alkalispirochaeta sp.]
MTKQDTKSTRWKLMTHLLAFYPDRPTSLSVAQAMIDGGSSYLEIQFPFSDPTADGPVIQGAGAQALAAGFTLEEGWQFVTDVLKPAKQAGVPVFVMSYASPVFVVGVDPFVKRAAEAGVEGLIVPDLPVDSDEGLYAAGRRYGVDVVPVIALGSSRDRIRLTLDAGSRYIYASLRRGTTGAYTTIGAENIAFMHSLTKGPAQVVAGFGISTPEQVAAVLEHAHAAVVGSAFVRAIEASAGAAAGPDAVYNAVRLLTEELTGAVFTETADTETGS